MRSLHFGIGTQQILVFSYTHRTRQMPIRRVWYTMFQTFLSQSNEISTHPLNIYRKSRSWCIFYHALLFMKMDQSTGGFAVRYSLQYSRRYVECGMYFRRNGEEVSSLSRRFWATTTSTYIQVSSHLSACVLALWIRFMLWIIEEHISPISDFSSIYNSLACLSDY